MWDGFPLAIIVVDLGYGVVSYCFGSSLFSKEPGRVFIWSLQFDSYVQVRAIGLFYKN